MKDAFTGAHMDSQDYTVMVIYANNVTKTKRFTTWVAAERYADKMEAANPSASVAIY